MDHNPGPAATYVYVDTAFGALSRRNHVQRVDDIDFADVSAERYISHRRASTALVDWTRSHTNASGKPTIEGFDGQVWDRSLPFDFDDRHDPAHALEWVRQFLRRLELEDVQLDALRFYFSGAKGFHVEIPHTLFGGFEPSDELHVYERAAAIELMGGIPFDRAVYDKLRLWRLPNTLNAKGQRYKIPLNLQEIRELTMEEILELAEHPQPRLAAAPDSDWLPNDYLVEVWARAQGQHGPVASDTQAVTSQWSDTRSSALFNAAVAAAIAASWPTDAAISRHSDFLLPLAGFLARHMDTAAVAGLLKDAVRLAGDTNFLGDRTRHWEDEIDRLAAGSADKIANGQPVEGLPTLGKRWPELADFLSTHYAVQTQSAAGSRNGSAEPKGFLFTALGELVNEPPEDIAYLVDGMLPSGGVSLWGAKPKVGKSVAVRNLALSVSRGEPFLERACHAGPVLVLALEEKRAEVAKHFRGMGGVDENVQVHVGAAPASSKDGLAALANAIALFQPVLVIADPVLKLVRVRDSSDYAELTRELEPVIELARTTGCHIAVTHHLGKMVREGGDDVLGSTAIFGAVDSLVVLRRRKDNVRVLQTIQRYGSDLPETLIPMDDSGHITLGSALSEVRQAEAKAKVRELFERLPESETLEQKEVRKQTEIDTGLITRALKDLLEEGILERGGEGKRGDPFRYCLSGRGPEKVVFLFSSTSTEKQENKKTDSPVDLTPGPEPEPEPPRPPAPEKTTNLPLE